jgi:hypothetical protein
MFHCRLITFYLIIQDVDLHLPAQKEVDWSQEKPVRGADSKSLTSSSEDYRSGERNARYDLAVLNFRRFDKFLLRAASVTSDPSWVINLWSK